MTNVQIRGVPESVNRELKARAAAEGRSLSEYLRDQLIRIASKPAKATLVARIGSREPMDVTDPTDELRRAREAR